MSINDNSEVLELYAEEAIKQGLISEAAEETNPRYDTHDITAIEALYGVQPNGEDDDVLDKAHPDPVIVSPAYDRVNGLVENLKERQNVMADIALKPNDGKHTQERYVKAQQDLFFEMKKATLLLERKNEDPALIRLADSCSEGFIKIAPLPAAPVLLTYVAVSAVITLLSAGVASQHMTINTALRSRTKLAIEKIDDLMKTWLNDPIPEYAQFGDLLEALHALQEASEHVSNLDIAGLRVSKDEIKQDPKSAVAKLKNSTKELEKQKALKIIDYHSKVSSVLLKEIPRYLDILNIQDEEKESWPVQFQRFFYKSDLPDAIEALEDLMTGLRKVNMTASKRKGLVTHFAGKESSLLDKLEKIEKEMGLEGGEVVDPTKVLEPESTDMVPSDKSKKEEEELSRIFPGYAG